MTQYDLNLDKVLNTGNLSLEQQFKLRQLHDQIQGLSEHQAKLFLLEAFKINMVKDNMYTNLIKGSML